MGSRKGPGALNKNFLILPGIESHLLGRPSRSLVINTNYVFSFYVYTKRGIYVYVCCGFRSDFNYIIIIIIIISKNDKIKMSKIKCICY